MAANVLLVDDEKGILKVLTIYLQDEGYTVFTADSGKKAADIIDSEDFDIVLTDIRMPGMDGISLLKHIKKNYPKTEVIMITGHGDYQLAIESLKLDAVDFITKPINNDVLDIALKRANDRLEARKQIQNYTQNLEGMVKEKTRELAESEKRYTRLFNESPSYITIQDKNLKIIETNHIFTRHFDYTQGQTCYEVYKQSSSPCPNCPVIKTFEDQQSHTAEMDVVLTDGSVRNIFIQTSAIPDESGRISHVMEMSTDVTIIHELQDHLAALGLHIASVSHGLKQLLTGLDGGAYMVESGLKKQDAQRIEDGWQIVKQKISETRQMVLDILFRTKKRKPEKSRVQLSELVKEIESAAAPKAQEASVVLKVTCPLDAELNIDKKSIFFALISMLENAVDACAHKKNKGRVNFEAEIDDRNVVFSIKDNGSGLDDKNKEKIFNLFYSEKGSKGTGLGLFIAKRSVRQHRGTIRVDSKPDEYTEFIVTLPLNKAD